MQKESLVHRFPSYALYLTVGEGWGGGLYQEGELSPTRGGHFLSQPMANPTHGRAGQDLDAVLDLATMCRARLSPGMSPCRGGGWVIPCT